jgi:flavin reductase (DIM6/NTAB) family NADH-FMN oxidoreductase RutF
MDRPAVDLASFREALARTARSAVVVTIGDRDEGLLAWEALAGFLTVSREPPLVAVSLGRRTRALALARRQTRLALNVMGEWDEALARRLAEGRTELAPLLDHLADVPVLPSALAVLAGRTVEFTPAGDHVLVTVLVEAVRYDDGWPLVEYRGKFYRLVPPEILESLAANFE